MGKTKRRYLTFNIFLLSVLASNAAAEHLHDHDKEEHVHHDHHHAGHSSHHQEGHREEKSHQKGHESHGLEAHTHGLASLAIAMEGDRLAVELESPAANIVGFEHQAKTAKERHKVKVAETLLSEHKKLFHFRGAQCALESHSLDMSGVAATTGQHDQHHEHHHESGKHKSDHHETGQHHGSHHPSSHDSENSHSEIIASYQYHCKHLDKLEAITVLIQDHFKGVETLEVMWVSEQHQGVQTLNPSNNIIRIEGAH